MSEKSVEREDSEKVVMVLDKDSHLPLYSPTCAHCRHLRSLAMRCCDAFPEEYGIPVEIWMGENAHRTPYPGDHGIRFEARKPAAVPEVKTPVTPEPAAAP